MSTNKTKQDNVPQVKTVEANRISEMGSVFNTLKEKYRTEKSILVGPEFRQGFIEGYEHQQSRIEELEELLQKSALQIDYLHKKFKETGSGNYVLARIEQALNSKEVGGE